MLSMYLIPANMVYEFFVCRKCFITQLAFKSVLDFLEPFFVLGDHVIKLLEVAFDMRGIKSANWATCIHHFYSRFLVNVGNAFTCSPS